MDSVDCVHAVSGVVTCITLQYWALMRSRRCGFFHAFCDFFHFPDLLELHPRYDPGPCDLQIKHWISI